MFVFAVCLLLLASVSHAVELTDDVVVSEEGGNGWGCTAILVAPGASKDGSSFTTHTNDCDNCDFRLAKVPARDHAEGAMRPVYYGRDAYPRFVGEDRGVTYLADNVEQTRAGEDSEWGASEAIGSIPEVAHTYGYLEGGYGIQNEHQLSIGESTCGALITALPVSQGGKALLDVRELSRLAMERSKTSREAVQLMGDMAEKYGYYGADATQGEAGEALTVTDPHESWMFHILADDKGTGAVWIAQRVPDDHICAVANQFVIHEFDLEDTDNFLGSDNIVEVATRVGLYKPEDGAFDFTHVYAMSRGHMSPYATRRIWRIFTMAAPSLLDTLSPNTNVWGDDYPFSVKPDTGLTVADVLRMKRDHYEGTDFDMTQGVAAGPYGDPSRFDPSGNLESSYDPVTQEESMSGQFERAISMYRTSYSFVTQSRASVPDELALIWWGQYAPHAACYTPVYTMVDEAPVEQRTGSLYKFNYDSSYWAHAALGGYADRFYLHTIGDIEEEQQRWEGKWFDDQAEVEREAMDRLDQHGRDDAKSFLAEYVNKNSADMTDGFWSLFELMLAKFKDGYRIDNFNAELLKPTKLFYPKTWLSQAGFWDHAEKPEAESVVGGRVRGDSATGAVVAAIFGGVGFGLAAGFVATRNYYLRNGATRSYTTVN